MKTIIPVTCGIILLIITPFALAAKRGLHDQQPQQKLKCTNCECDHCSGCECTETCDDDGCSQAR